MQKIAYIYIMTNESFKGHDWVKIGYAKDPEKRRRQLSTTNIPYPYAIYATYEIPESEHLGDKAFHKIITTLNPNLRLTNNREFFEISPENAYELLRSIALINGKEDKLVLYDNSAKESLKKTKKEKKQGTQTVGEDVDSGFEEFVININDDEAIMRVNIDSFVLKAGSAVRINLNQNNPAKKLQEEDINSGLLVKENDSLGRLTKDKIFKSSSGSSKYVCGYSCNGKVIWHTRSGVTLGEYLYSEKK